MKLVDSKGRLFGKLNLIDLLVILLIVVVLAAAVLKLTGADTAGNHYSKSLNRPLIYTVVCRMVYRPVAEEMMAEKGNQLMAGGEMVEGCFITDVEMLPHYDTYVDGEGKPLRVESEEYRDLLFTISGEAPFVENAYKVGTQEVRVGKNHIVKTVTLEITGTIQSLEETA